LILAFDVEIVEEGCRIKNIEAHARRMQNQESVTPESRIQ